MKVNIKSINWGSRIREDYGDIDLLADSISRLGLLHPIVIDESMTLRAGGRRLTAVISLGLDNIEVTMLGELSKIEQKEIELEENIIRKDLTWQEEVSLKTQLDDLKREQANEKDEEWGVEETAKILGESRKNTQRDIQLASALEEFPELSNEKDKATARTKARRLQQDRLRSIVAKEIITPEGLHLGDCVEIIKTLPDNSIDLVLADPPFGIDFPDKLRNQAYKTTYGKFPDTIMDVGILLDQFLPSCFRVMKEGAHLYLFYGVQYYNRIEMALQRSGFVNCYQKTPLIWIKSSQENSRPYHRFAMNYEAFLFCWKPPFRELVKPHNSSFHHEPIKSITKRHHPAQKPSGLYQAIIELSSYEGEVVADFFMGSGISLKTAKEMNRKIIGVEFIKEWFDLAKININKGD